MPASLGFQNGSGAAAANLSDAIKAVYNDGSADYEVNFYSAYTSANVNTPATGIGNATIFVYKPASGTDEYIVDNSTSGELTFKLVDAATPSTPVIKYSLTAGTTAELSNILKLLGSGTDADIVKKLLSVTDSGTGKLVLADKVAEQAVVDELLKPDVLKTKVAHQDVVEGILAATRTNSQSQQKEQILETELLKPDVLKAKVAHADVVAELTGAADFTNKVFTKTTPTDKVYTKTQADNAFAAKSDVEVDSLISKLTAVGADDTKKVYTRTEAGNAFAAKPALGAFVTDRELAEKVKAQAVVEGILAATRTNAQSQQEKILETELLKPDVLKVKVAHQDVTDVLANAFATKGHTHSAPTSGQTTSPAPQPAVVVDLSQLGDTDVIPDSWTNGL